MKEIWILFKAIKHFEEKFRKYLRQIVAD